MERDADEILDADGHYFTVTFPGLVNEPTAAMGEMIRVRQEHGGFGVVGGRRGAVAGVELWRL